MHKDIYGHMDAMALALTPMQIIQKTVLKWIQGGLLPVINGVVTTISKVITPVTHLFSAIYSTSSNIAAINTVSHDDGRNAAPPWMYMMGTFS